MNTFKHGLVLSLAAIIAVLSVWACQATRNGRQITITFAPDMVITAWGLEDALQRLTDLLDSCMNGTYGRPCTDLEREEISQSIQRVLEVKARIYHPEPVVPVGDVPC